LSEGLASASLGYRASAAGDRKRGGLLKGNAWLNLFDFWVFEKWGFGAPHKIFLEGG
jgi:hypothetical protein